MKYTVILGLVLSIVGVTSFFKSETKFDLKRIPADVGVDGRISTTLEKIKAINSFEKSNVILDEVIKDLLIIKTDESRVLAYFFKSLKNSEGLFFSLESVIEKFPVFSVGSVTFFKNLRRSIPAEAKFLHVLIDRLFINNNSEQYASVESFQKDIVVNEKYLKDILNLHKSLVKATQKYPITAKPINLFKVDLSAYAGLWGKFIPESKKVVIVNSAMLHIAKAELEKIVSHIYFLSAYNLEKFGELRSSSLKAVSKKVFGITYRVPLEDSNKFSSMTYHKKMNKDYYKKVLTLHKWAKKNDILSESKKWALRSLSSTSDAIVTSKQVPFEKMSDGVHFDKKIIETYALKSQRAVEYELKLLASNSTQEIIDPLTAKSLKINPSEIFNQEKMNELRGFFPTAHDKSKTILKYGVKTTNLNYGNPIKWNDYSFGGVFPDNNQKDFFKTIRIINTHSATTWLSSWLSLFL